MTSAAVRRFADIAARVRAAVWPCTITTAAGARVCCAKSGSKRTRLPDELGTGYIWATVTTFNFQASGNFLPEIGAKWTVSSAEIADEVGTVWSCKNLVRAAAGMEHVCTCWKVDS
ncbi:MAG: hypothetical protein H7343_12320 [Undibacterium sp.]|nr:hypothetical protein [Opitutaceae bacterium]